MESKNVTYRNISDYFIALSNASGNLITNLKLQKLVYYTQAWHLAVYKEPIFAEDFEAWVHGPVIPGLYNDYRAFQWRPIERDDLQEDSILGIKAELPRSVNEILEDVIEEYFGMEAYALEKSTHLEAPWIIARGGLPSDEPCNNVITKESMVTFYSPFVVNG